MPLTRDTFLYRGALVVGVLPVFLSSVNPIFRPEPSMRGLGFRVPADSQDRRTALMLVRVIGIRNLVIMASLVSGWLSGSGRRVAEGLAGLAFIAATDGVLVRGLGIRTGGWREWPFVPVLLGFSAGFMGWI